MWEWYFYVTVEAETYVTCLDWYPLEKGQTYVIFGTYTEYVAPTEEQKYKSGWIDYPQDQYPLIMPLQEGSFCISMNAPRKEASFPKNYLQMWKDIKAMYGSACLTTGVGNGDIAVSRPAAN